MQCIVQPNGTIRCLYTELLDLRVLGNLQITRASSVEPDQSGNWHADLAAAGGPVLGPHAKRSDAIAAEAAWLNANELHG